MLLLYFQSNEDFDDEERCKGEEFREGESRRH